MLRRWARSSASHRGGLAGMRRCGGRRRLAQFRWGSCTPSTGTCHLHCNHTTPSRCHLGGSHLGDAPSRGVQIPANTSKHNTRGADYQRCRQYFVGGHLNYRGNDSMLSTSTPCSVRLVQSHESCPPPTAYPHFPTRNVPLSAYSHSWLMRTLRLESLSPTRGSTRTRSWSQPFPLLVSPLLIRDVCAWSNTRTHVATLDEAASAWSSRLLKAAGPFVTMAPAQHASDFFSAVSTRATFKLTIASSRACR